MIQKRSRIFFILFAVLTFAACSKYQKVLKSDDVNYKYEMAIKYYEKDDYIRAYPVFEEIIPILRGTDKAEVAMYYYSYCNYYLSDYYLASYSFKKLYRTYPNGSHAEEALYMHAYCDYINSPSYSLDQTNTRNAIKEMQEFVNAFPDSPKVDTCNMHIDELRAKLERKSFENAQLYYKTRFYKSAIIALNNTLKDFPNTAKAEEINYLLFKSKYYLAENSILNKKEQRLDDVIDSYYNFVDQFANSEYIRECEELYQKAVDERNKFETIN